ncbi:hypothetical protein ZWY2020_006219 [Hordeum vulgare]|nr:hypothetical protein ZWY2020_006219 [Hordeum vulgare]
MFCVGAASPQAGDLVASPRSEPREATGTAVRRPVEAGRPHALWLRARRAPTSAVQARPGVVLGGAREHDHGLAQGTDDGWPSGARPGGPRGERGTATGVARARPGGGGA